MPYGVIRFVFFVGLQFVLSEPIEWSCVERVRVLEPSERVDRVSRNILPARSVLVVVVVVVRHFFDQFFRSQFLAAANRIDPSTHDICEDFV